MRAITIHQPYASLIAIGAKRFETRAFPPPAKLIGQRIAIHAGARKVSEFRPCLPGAWGPAIDALSPLHGGGEFRFTGLPHGAVVCTAVIKDAFHVRSLCVTGPYAGMVEMASTSSGEARRFRSDPFGDYSPGRWAWLLTDVVRLAEPVPAKGKQGWWEWAAVDADAMQREGTHG